MPAATSGRFSGIPSQVIVPIKRTKRISMKGYQPNEEEEQGAEMEEMEAVEKQYLN